MKTLKKLCAAAVLGMASFSASAGVVYVGSWDVFGGVGHWTGQAPTYTGQEAAALLFGGQAGDYVISTLGDNAANINLSAWYDRYGIGLGVYAQNFRVDGGTAGIYDIFGDSSAYIIDNGGGTAHLNYAFRVDGAGAGINVPEPVSLGLLGIGLLGLAATRRKAR